MDEVTQYIVAGKTGFYRACVCGGNGNVIRSWNDASSKPCVDEKGCGKELGNSMGASREETV